MEHEEGYIWKETIERKDRETFTEYVLDNPSRQDRIYLSYLDASSDLEGLAKIIQHYNIIKIRNSIVPTNGDIEITKEEDKPYRAVLRELLSSREMKKLFKLLRNDLL